MKCVVTGATGFTGFNVAKRLKADGLSVVALVRDSSNTAELEEAGIPFERVDFFNEAELAAQIKGAEKVFHIAAAYRTEGSDTSEFTRTNVDLTRLLLEVSLSEGVHRFVHCSTVGVQGEIEDPPAREDYRMNPGDHYQESKLVGEQLALEFNTRGLDTTVVRPVGIYGPGDERFLKLFKGIDRSVFFMIGSGRTLYHLTYIDDLVEGFLLASEHQRAVGEVFTICGPRYTTLNELVAEVADALGARKPKIKIPLSPVLAAAHVSDWICKKLGVASPLYPRRVEFFRFDRAFTHAKATSMLGYKPQVDLRDGIRRTAEGYRQRGLL